MSNPFSNIPDHELGQTIAAEVITSDWQMVDPYGAARLEEWLLAATPDEIRRDVVSRLAEASSSLKRMSGIDPEKMKRAQIRKALNERRAARRKQKKAERKQRRRL